MAKIPIVDHGRIAQKGKKKCVEASLSAWLSNAHPSLAIVPSIMAEKTNQLLGITVNQHIALQFRQVYFFFVIYF
jgi:hypothetical protein